MTSWFDWIRANAAGRDATLLIYRPEEVDGARAALARVECGLVAREEPPQAYEWVLLAETWGEVLNDMDQVRRILEVAVERLGPGASDVLSGGFVQLLGDRNRARELLEDAERRARAEPGTSGASALRDVATAWRKHLGDGPRAQTCLLDASARIDNVQDLQLIGAVWWHEFRDQSSAHAVLARAESLCRTSDDWFWLAERYFQVGDREHPWDRGAISRCLIRAADVATGDQRWAVASALRWWVREEEAAAVVLPIEPAEMATPVVVPLDGWPPGDPYAVLHAIRRHIGPESLRRIAASDYGADRDQETAILEELCASGVVRGPLSWHPLEVLELTRNDPGGDHHACVFCCAVLAVDAMRPDARQCAGADIGHTLGPLIESAWTLGLDEPLEALLLWLARVTPPYEPPWGLLGLVLSRARREPDDPRLSRLVETLEAVVPGGIEGRSAHGWLFNSTFFDSRHALWRRLVRQTLAPLGGRVAALDRLATRLQSGDSNPS